MTAEVIQRQITTNSTHSKEHRWQYCGELHNINSSTVLQSSKEIKHQKEDNPTLQNNKYRLNGLEHGRLVSVVGALLRFQLANYTMRGLKNLTKPNQYK